MELLDAYTHEPWLALVVAILSMCGFVVADVFMLASPTKGPLLMISGVLATMAMPLAEWAFLAGIGSSIQALWLVFFLAPASILMLLALWICCIPGVESKDRDGSLKWWKRGAGCALLIWFLGTALSGLGFAIDASAVLLPCLFMSRRVCLARYVARSPSPIISERCPS